MSDCRKFSTVSEAAVAIAIAIAFLGCTLRPSFFVVCAAIAVVSVGVAAVVAVGSLLFVQDID
jgi:hypothetical protein